MEWTRNSRVNPMTLKCNLDIESAYIAESFVLHTISILGTFQRSLMKFVQRV